MAKVKSELSSIELLEEALHLLRTNPASLACYYLGSVPFVLGLLFFWADMSRSAYAAARCANSALLLALGYIWMKCWQTAAARALWRGLGVRGHERWGWRQVAALVATQTILHAWGLALLPVMLVLILPFPFYHAWCQNVTAIGLGGRDGTRGVLRRAWRQAALWPGQNAGLVVNSGFFALLVLVNVMMAMGMIPYLLKTVLGIESRFTQSSSAMLNSTFFAAAFALTYLCVDPLLKAAYVLRCFYGESLKTGDALWAELHRIKRIGVGALGVVMGIVLVLMMAAGSPGWAAGKAGDAAREAGVTAAQLDGAIGETMHEARYTWHLPRKLQAPEPEENKSLPRLFLEAVGRTLMRWVEGLGRAIGKFFDWLGRQLGSSGGRSSTPTSSGGAAGLQGILTLTRILICLFAAIVLTVAGITVWRIWQGRQQLLAGEVEPGTTLEATPDLSDEKTSADQLPADGWLALAQQMFDRGEARLALRALYLASLAALGQAGLVRIRKSKSNLDYVKEMMRREHAWPGLLDLFRGNVAAFDRAWYGMHEVTPEGFLNFKTTYERIRALVG